MPCDCATRDHFYGSPRMRGEPGGVEPALTITAKQPPLRVVRARDDRSSTPRITGRVSVAWTGCCATHARPSVHVYRGKPSVRRWVFTAVNTDRLSADACARMGITDNLARCASSCSPLLMFTAVNRKPAGQSFYVTPREHPGILS